MSITFVWIERSMLPSIRSTPRCPRSDSDGRFLLLSPLDCPVEGAAGIGPRTFRAGRAVAGTRASNMRGPWPRPVAVLRSVPANTRRRRVRGPAGPRCAVPGYRFRSVQRGMPRHRALSVTSAASIGLVTRAVASPNSESNRVDTLPVVGSVTTCVEARFHSVGYAQTHLALLSERR